MELIKAERLRLEANEGSERIKSILEKHTELSAEVQELLRLDSIKCMDKLKEANNLEREADELVCFELQYYLENYQQDSLEQFLEIREALRKAVYEYFNALEKDELLDIDRKEEHEINLKINFKTIKDK